MPCKELILINIICISIKYIITFKKYILDTWSILIFYVNNLNIIHL
jgi:hypothetical protein